MFIRVGLFKEPFSAVSHFVGFLAAIVGLFYLVVLTAHDPAKLTVATLYGLGLSGVFLASTLYHFFDLGHRGNRWLNQLDHIAIFLMIGGSNMPPALQLLDGSWRIGVLAIIGSITVAGALFKLVWFDSPLWLSTGLYLLMGWSCLIPLTQMFPLISTTQLALLIAGGLAYTVGALIYASERPDPWPSVFGHHEIWHLFVLAGAACHFAFNTRILSQAYPPF